MLLRKHNLDRVPERILNSIKKNKQSLKIIKFDKCWRETRAPYAKLGLHFIHTKALPVNLTCKLTKKQQIIKYESVSAGFPNNSHTAYRQEAADIENDNRSNGISKY